MSRVTNEEFEEKRDFILEQQAQFSFDIQQLREVVANAAEAVARLDWFVWDNRYDR